MLTATVLTETPLPNLPSASGVEVVGATAYMVSDDAPWLYRLDAATLAPVAGGPLALFASEDFGSGRLPKASKPDLEAMAFVALPGGGLAGLLLLGSGATPRRETGYFIPFDDQREAGGPARAVALSALYARLRTLLPPGATLNLEALATTDTELIFLQRGIGAGPAGGAWLLAWPLRAALAHLLGGAPLAGAPRAVPCELPALDGHPASFSGATVAAGKLWVTASAEDTADAVLDGPVLGSLVGRLDPQTGRGEYARLTWADGRPYRGKVEGLALTGQRSGVAEWLLVTDDDRGGSTAVRAEVSS